MLPRFHRHCSLAVRTCFRSLRGHFTAMCDRSRPVVPTKKTAPVLSVKAELLGPAGVVWSARRAPTSQFSARCFSRGVMGMSGCGVKSRALGGCGFASEFDADGDRRLGHRRSDWHRLGYCPQQDVPSRSRSSSSELLAKQDQGLGQWRACDLPSGLLGRRASHARVLKGGLEFSAERSLASGRTRLRRCMAGCQ
jgi:hypothetical protein